MFKKLFSSSVEKKDLLSGSPISYFLNLDSIFKNAESSSKFIDYYFQSSPVFTATKLIAKNVSAIPIVVYDKNSGKIVEKHPIYDLLNNPNPFTDGVLFKEELYSYFILTGNCYLNITGSTRPVELNVINPAKVRISANQKDGYPESYTISNSSSIEYRRNPNKKFKSSNDNELAHLRNFNPNYSSNDLCGISTFAGVELEISQYILASIHNNALLKNQGRPSGFISYKGDKNLLSEEQAQKINEQIQAKLQGAANAGRALFLSGNFDWQALSESIKDMDFGTLKSSTAEATFNAAGIPLPMVSPDNMTLANMDSAKYNFYDNTILPTVKKGNAFLTKSVLSRYPNSENLELGFDESDIEALEQRKTENISNLYKNGLINLNEARKEIGYEGVKGDGGNLFYQPMNLIPIGSDNYTQDSRDKPVKSVEKAEYIRLMTSMKDLKGNRMYDDDLIKKNVDIYYN